MKQKFPVMGLLVERKPASGNDFAYWVTHAVTFP